MHAFRLRLTLVARNNNVTPGFSSLLDLRNVLKSFLKHLSLEKQNLDNAGTMLFLHMNTILRK